MTKMNGFKKMLHFVRDHAGEEELYSLVKEKFNKETIDKFFVECTMIAESGRFNIHDFQDEHYKEEILYRKHREGMRKEKIKNRDPNI